MIRIYFILTFFLVFIKVSEGSAQSLSNEAIAYFVEAEYLYADKDYNKALEYLNIAEKNWGEPNARTVHLKIKILFELERYNEAQQLINTFGRYESSEDIEEATYYYHKKIAEKEREESKDGGNYYFEKGYNAYQERNWAIAEKYLNKSIDLKYGNGNAVIILYQLLAKIGAYTKIEKNLIRGYKTYPENDTIIAAIIDYYINTCREGYALDFLNEMIALKPNKASYYYARGALYDNKKFNDQAIYNYEICLNLDSGYFNALYNLGSLYYNIGVKQMSIANTESDSKRFQSKKKIANIYYRKSLPYLEKARKINPIDVPLLESLKSLYFRFDILDKYDEVNNKLSKL